MKFNCVIAGVSAGAREESAARHGRRQRLRLGRLDLEFRRPQRGHAPFPRPQRPLDAGQRRLRALLHLGQQPHLPHPPHKPPPHQPLRVVSTKFQNFIFNYFVFKYGIYNFANFFVLSCVFFSPVVFIIHVCCSKFYK
jgi:hypothetical protein